MKRLSWDAVFFGPGCHKYPPGNPCSFCSDFCLSHPKSVNDMVARFSYRSVFDIYLPALSAVFLPADSFSRSIRKSLLVSFAGLRGAASIVFAIITVLSPISTENDLFHIAFVVVLFSIALQGSLLPLISNKLNMIDKEGNVFKTFTDYVDETPINFIQFAITKNHEWCDKCVSELTLPPGSILVNLQRGETQLVPKGDTRLLDGDLLVMCSMECKQVPDLFLTEKLIEKTICMLTPHWRMCPDIPLP